MHNMDTKNALQRNTLVVGLDLSAMDKELIGYIQTLESWLPAKQIIFMHNVKLSELPEHLKKPETLESIAKRIEHKLRRLIEQTYKPETSFSVIVTMQEFSELAFADLVKQSGASLVVLGNKQQLEGSGGLSQKLIRMLPASVLLVPETCKSKPQHILQAIDFSKYTPLIVQWGQALGVRKTPVYVSKMSFSFFPGFSEEEMNESLAREQALRSKKWQELFPDQPALAVLPAYEKSIASALLDYAGRQKADMIVMGVKGATSLTNLFMGSVANEMVQRETELCLLMVKRTYG